MTDSTGKIYLRALEPHDLDALYRWENDTALWQVGTTIAPFSRKQLYDYIAEYSNDIYAAGQLRLMICRTADDAAIGTIDLTDFCPAAMRAQVGILIAPEFQCQGYGSLALNATIDYARQTLHMHQLYAMIPEGNDASLALFGSAGFKAAGRLRSWLRLPSGGYADVMVQQLLF